jgi:hypothetical protein
MSFGVKHRKPEAFDQQPVEAAAVISACAAAWQADGRSEWLDEAMRAFAWFLGENDLRASLITETGGCLDGLHPDRPNENMGAESTLSYLLGLSDMRRLVRMAKARSPAQSVPRLMRNAAGTNGPPTLSGDLIVSISIPESAGLVSAAGPGKSGRETVQAGD